jgi:predicted lipid-binding transport protein (Tim44 family)
MKKLLALFLAVLMTLSLCACGSAKNTSAAAPMEAAQSNYRSDYKSEAAAAADFAYEESVAGGFSAAAKTESTAGQSEEAPEIDPEKIIYSSDVTVETTDFDTTIAKVEALVKSYGGWIESSSVNGANYYDTSRGYTRNRSADYSLRIPSSRFQELMGSLSDLGNIPYSHTYTENVTAQYYDVQARLTAYEAQEARLLEMMQLAETVEDVIALESRLSDLRYQIESLQSTLKNWDRRVSYSSVYLNISEVRAYTPEPEKRISYGEELLGALRDGLQAVGDFFKNALVILAACLPMLIVLAVLAVLIIWLVRKILARKKARKEAKRAAALAQTAPQEPKDKA